MVLISPPVIQFAPAAIEQILAECRDRSLSDVRLFRGVESEGRNPRSHEPSQSRYRARAGRSEIIKHSRINSDSTSRLCPLPRHDPSYVVFDFGKSFFQGSSCHRPRVEKMPVSIRSALDTLIGYLISIPLGSPRHPEGSNSICWTTR